MCLRRRILLRSYIVEMYFEKHCIFHFIACKYTSKSVSYNVALPCFWILFCFYFCCGFMRLLLFIDLIFSRSFAFEVKDKFPILLFICFLLLAFFIILNKKAFIFILVLFHDVVIFQLLFYLPAWGNVDVLLVYNCFVFFPPSCLMYVHPVDAVVNHLSCIICFVSV